MKKLNVGDIVVMASGGPKMTISSIEYTCTWFDDNFILHTTKVSPEALKIQVDEEYDAMEAPTLVDLAAKIITRKAEANVENLTNDESINLLERTNKDYPITLPDTFSIIVENPVYFGCPPEVIRIEETKE